MPTYFDHNATTPLDPGVRDAMLPWLGAGHGNPSSVHAFGRKAWQAVEEAREMLAALLSANPLELVLTASGTEANNTAIEACARGAGKGGHIVVSTLEHPSVARVVDRLEQEGFEVTRVACEKEGVVDSQRLVESVREDTILVCLILANNELGTIQPVAEVARELRRKRVPLLCDAVQAVGKIPVNVEELGVDFLTLGAHKFYGPPGAAALWIRKGTPFSALLLGGNQERRRRAGTVNVPAVVGLGRAAQLAAENLEGRGRKLAALRKRFESGLDSIPGTRIHGRGAERLPNTTLVGFAGVEAESLLIRLDLAGYAVSAGSACSSGSVEPSQALLALGLSKTEALSCLRISFGIANTPEEVEGFIPVLSGQVGELQRFAGVG